MQNTLYSRFFKRALDFSMALAMIVALSPIYLLLYVLIRINMGSPTVFRQERPGFNEKIFTVMKFRSMNSKRGEDGKLLPDAQRITPLGKFLRKSSLDELPQLFNVLKGDMSFVGPRPLLPRYLPYYTEEEKLRHSVRPGITGLAQVNGRNAISWDRKLAYDVEYVKNISFLNDLKILLLTAKKVLFGNDINVVPTGDFLDVERKRKREGKDKQ